jgi:hypothetical protein
MGEPDEIHMVPRDYARRHPKYARGLTTAQPYLAPDDPRRDTNMPNPPNQPQQPQPPAQGQTQGQPQPAGQQHPVEQQLLRAGASRQHLQQARALGISPDQLAAFLVKYIPVVIELWQELRGGQGGGGQPAPTPAGP